MHAADAAWEAVRHTKICARTLFFILRTLVPHTSLLHFAQCYSIRCWQSIYQVNIYIVNGRFLDPRQDSPIGRNHKTLVLFEGVTLYSTTEFNNLINYRLTILQNSMCPEAEACVPHLLLVILL